MRHAATAAALLLLCLAVAAAAEAPRLFWASEPVEPGEVALLFGHALDGNTTVRLARLKDAPAGSAFVSHLAPLPADAVPLDLLQGSPECLKCLVPAKLAPGVFAFTVATSGGNLNGLLNRCGVRWLQGDQGFGASPGGWVRAFGTRLSWTGAKTVAALLKSDAGKPAAGAREIPLTASAADMWSAQFPLPPGLPPGEYLFAAHAGKGGPAGWSDALPLTVTVPERWPQTVFNVRDFGATGSGSSEDVAALQRALAAAGQNGGGIVYLPRGMYACDDTLRLPPRTVLRGEKRELTALFWPERDVPLPDGQVLGTDHFALEDLSLYWSNYAHGIVGDLQNGAGGHIRLERVLVRGNIYRGHLSTQQVADRFSVFMRLGTGGGDTVRFGGPHLVIRDCDLYGAGRSIFLRAARGGVVANNQIYQGRWGWYSFVGCDRLIFQDNAMTGADLMSTGGGLHNYDTNYSENIYFAGNTLRLMHGWDREAMTSDAGGAAYYGGVSACRGTSLTLTGKADWARGWQGAGVFLLGGRGMGQWRRLLEGKDQTAVVDRPWDVEPDATSVLTITQLHHNYFFINNHFEDAGVALQYYGTSIDCVAAGNSCERSGGFSASGRWYHGYQPSWYCQFLDNQILEGNGYRFWSNNATNAGLSILGTEGLQYGDNPAPLALAGVHRRNHLRNNAQMRFLGTSAERPALLDALAENNLIENSPVGIFVDQGVRGLLLRGNRFNNVKYPSYDSETIERLRREQLAPYLNRPDPIIHWAFEANPLTSVTNSAGPAFTLVPRGTPTPVPGVQGQGAHFDGKSFFLALGSDILNLDSYTLSAWFRVPVTAGRWGLLAKRTSGIVSPFVLAVQAAGFDFNATDADGKWSTYSLRGGGGIKPNQWHHVAVTLDGQTASALYLDGKRLLSGGPFPVKLCGNDQQIAVGYEEWGGPRAAPGQSGNLLGDLDEVKLWTRALSAEEIAAEFAALKPQ